MAKRSFYDLEQAMMFLNANYAIKAGHKLVTTKEMNGYSIQDVNLRTNTVEQTLIIGSLSECYAFVNGMCYAFRF